MVGTFYNRLVGELRLTTAAAMAQANAVLQDFLLRFNNRFRVPARRPQAAYRPSDCTPHPERSVRFKHTH